MNGVREYLPEGEFASLPVLPADHSRGDGKTGKLLAADIIADPVMPVYTRETGLKMDPRTNANLHEYRKMTGIYRMDRIGQSTILYILSIPVQHFHPLWCRARHGV